ncbi:hypothetical protein [uncultured Ruminococcus sp.]|uniref:hypothetical protein n=1 Tax=uncultured Ruminococcus sp. TaxID=165186 RepID=UPI0025F27B35|nr:hypothetical protein [uncultured Ruminococcus sp.]
MQRALAFHGEYKGHSGKSECYMYEGVLTAGQEEHEKALECQLFIEASGVTLRMD